MLRDPRPTLDVPAAELRVSPVELADAIASIERRRHHNPPAAAGIPLGDAVRELSLDFTPEDLLAEIYARRAESLEDAETVQRTTPQVSLKARYLTIALGLSLLFNFYLMRLQPAADVPATAIVAAGPAVSTSGAAFAQTLRAIQANSFDEGKLAYVRAASKTTRFTCAQARQILETFSFDDGRKDAAKALYPGLEDPQNFLPLLEVFSFDSSREELLRELGLS